MSFPSSFAHWRESRSLVAHDPTEADEEALESSDLESCGHESIGDDEEYHEEEFHGILALAEVAHMAFAESGRMYDLEDYIAYIRDALTVAPRDGSFRAGLLHRLAYNLHLSATQGDLSRGDSADRLHEGVDLHRQALDCLPSGHADRALYMTQLANCLRARYAHTNSVEDLQECIAWNSSALSLRPPGDPHRTESLANLADAYWTRFGRTRHDGDLNETLRLDEENLLLHPSGDNDRAIHLLNLASVLGERSANFGTVEDLERALHLEREALTIVATVEDRNYAIQQLATHLFAHFRATRDHSSLHDAISLGSGVVQSTHHDTFSQTYTILRTLADAIITRYTQESQDRAHLDDAIRYYKQALTCLPALSPRIDRLALLLSLASALTIRFSHFHEFDDIDEATNICVKAVDSCGKADSYYSRCQRALAQVYIVRHSTLMREEDLQEATDHYAQAVENPYGYIRDRAAYGHEWVALLIRHRSHPQRILQAFTSVSTLFRLACLEAGPRTMRGVLDDVSAMSDEVVHHFLSLSEMEKAVEALEQGRHAIWSAKGLIKTVPSAFQERLRSIVHELNCPAAHSPRFRLRSYEYLHASNSFDSTSAAQHQNLVGELNSLLEHIRIYPGMSNFLQPIKYVDIIAGCSTGPIVALVARPRCEAIILCSTFSGPRRVQLALTVEQLKELQAEFIEIRGYPNDSRCMQLLDRTWEGIVGPVLDCLSYQGSRSKSQPKPRLWWCPTGPFTFIPLHAARQPRTGSQSTWVMDHVVSSYTPTITAVRAAQQRQSQNPQTVTLAGVQLAQRVWHRDELQSGMPAESPSSSTSSSVYSPITPICSEDRSSGSRALSASRSSATCLTCAEGTNVDLLPDNIQSPSQTLATTITDAPSPLFLDTFTSESFDARHPSRPPCDVDSLMPLADELSQSGSALLYSGFRSVIDTIPGWPKEAYESHALILIKQIHRDIYDRTDPDFTVIPYALDRAIRRLRDSGRPLTHWIPFIHVGY